jgi:murein DD-endopeptidase MepM/ murein hydrolase activator NlpD
MGDLIRVLMAGVFAVVSWNASAGGWPPEPMVEIQVPVEPTAFPADGRHYLVYELRLTSLAKFPSVIRRLEVRDAQSTASAPLASYEGSELDAVLQHFGDPAVGDRMPTAGVGYRELAPGESALVFLTVVLEPGVQVPARLVHRLSLDDGAIDGAPARTHPGKLSVIWPPLVGGTWQALSGAGDNTSHHRRQFVVFGGRCLMPTRNAIDWKLSENGASSFGTGDKNSDYFSYGKPVLAVADGRIVATLDGIEDNHPGHVGAEAFNLTRENIGGNYVVLALGDGRFAQYMHLKPGSLRVKTGDRVRRGQTIAAVGSSGSSFEPHLHFQVTDTASPIEGEGLPYVIDGFQRIDGGLGVRHTREMPLKGWLVEFPAVR